MFNWQVTATTVHCESADDEVTIMVYRDGSVKCTGYQKYHKSAKNSKAPVKGTGCTGPDCPSAMQYREKLLAEQAKAKGQP
ncbi:MAG: hypothetical protein PHR43_00435 [Dehalococcoidales bacterium]|nr:hypothetical protein [Dehalococcoidales bacterium]